MSDAVKPDAIGIPDLSSATLVDRLRFARLAISELIREGDDLGAEYRSHLEKASGHVLLATHRIEEADRVRRHLQEKRR